MYNFSFFVVVREFDPEKDLNPAPVQVRYTEIGNYTVSLYTTTCLNSDFLQRHCNTVHFKSCKTSSHVRPIIEYVLQYSFAEMGLDEYLNCGLLHGMKEEPWHVTLLRKGSVHCSGVIINSHWVLTAADCVFSTEIEA